MTIDQLLAIPRSNSQSNMFNHSVLSDISQLLAVTRSDSLSSMFLGHDFSGSLSQTLDIIRSESQSRMFTHLLENKTTIKVRPRMKSESKMFDLLIGSGLAIEIGRANSNSFIIPISVLGSDALVLTLKRANSISLAINPGLAVGVSGTFEVIRAISRSMAFPPNFVSNILENFKWGDNVFLLINDHRNNTRFYRGVIRNIDDSDRYIDIKAMLGEGILSERIIKENYPEQDIGLTAKQIIDTYCRPITSIGVDTNTGFEAPIEADGKTPIKVLEDLRRNYRIHFYVSNTWDLSFYKVENINEDHNYMIQLGEGGD